uniref:folate gamma-glutamyl hydrolase n=1 Tax=Chromera velia CCMP2878 TaxID=1169474 RepID=A0A0G4IDR5_9ALVE|mmetsp:Transcript_23606/g.46380  ORF Transcript_23606/g.46380 Transcript_23606/m.46380 type:complete len:420 (+) Transcript_23606:169-1428(+)|eukprot:Cvel_13524.t1-p1 / transcript=Cvel_13524.t1 / gene=Cvel_13524 / organism=Chromera_velia_CCMP2878 / gene_product=Gamma-glutamyl hydrolase, putative / transcript_product=Gamma-glutamyl hydrolase, putative / location=Cvel_scaffold927:56110-61243(-) / protein_length=419 / sequence_SO=supercontig / SO=protein_coding / is_pseudo=false
MSLLSFVWALVGVLCVVARGGREAPPDAEVSRKPVVGIWSNEADEPFRKMMLMSDQATSYVLRSVVDWLRRSGVDVVPLVFDQSEEEIIKQLGEVNGLVFQGGHAVLNSTQAEWRLWMQRTSFVYEKAKALNNEDPGSLPVFAICQGLEVVSVLEGGPSILTRSGDTDGYFLTEFDPAESEEGKQSVMWTSAPPDVKKFLQDDKSTTHFHQWQVTKANFRAKGLDQKFRLVGANTDPEGNVFVSAFEDRSAPPWLFAVQFHPEVRPSQVDTRLRRSIHSLQQESKALQYFGDLFASQVSKSLHRFSDPATDRTKLVEALADHLEGDRRARTIQGKAWDMRYFEFNPNFPPNAPLPPSQHSEKEKNQIPLFASSGPEGRPDSRNDCTNGMDTEGKCLQSGSDLGEKERETATRIVKSAKI